MSSARLIRPFARALARPSIKPVNIAFFSTRKALPVVNAKTKASKKETISERLGFAGLPVQDKAVRFLQSGMPQLVPFYFVNEVSTAFVLLPALIYLFSKYVLPQRVRTMCARLFVSKL